MDPILVEMLGFAAGATNLASSVPQLLANLREPGLARGQSQARNAFQCAGNLMWLIYAIPVGSIAMMTFAGLGCAMAGLLLAQTCGTRRQAV